MSRDDADPGDIDPADWAAAPVEVWHESMVPAVPPMRAATPTPAWWHAWREAFRAQVAARPVLS